MSKKKKTFTTRAAIPSDYQEGVRYRGALSGTINPGEVAVEVFGEELAFGRLFAYCYRRFGHPNSGSDPDKHLAIYNLTTPIDGVFLSVCIRPTNDPQLLFGYVLAADIEMDLMREDREILTESDKRVELFGKSMDTIHPGPKATHVLGAIKAALEDLKTPVGVRDVLFSAISDEADDEDCSREADRFHAAGYFFPEGYMQNPESFVRLSDKLRAIGNGSLSAGIEKFIAE